MVVKTGDLQAGDRVAGSLDQRFAQPLVNCNHNQRDSLLMLPLACHILSDDFIYRLSLKVVTPADH